jgi:hypothetical protein
MEGSRVHDRLDRGALRALPVIVASPAEWHLGDHPDVIAMARPNLALCPTGSARYKALVPRQTTP